MQPKQFNFGGKIYTITDQRILDYLSFDHFGGYEVPIIPSFDNIYYAVNDDKLVAFKFKAFFYLNCNSRYFVAEGKNGLFLIKYDKGKTNIWESISQYMDYQKTGYSHFCLQFQTSYMMAFVESTTDYDIGALSNGVRYFRAFRFGEDGNIITSDISDKVIVVNYFYVDKFGTHCDTTITKEGWHRTKQEAIDDACNIEVVGFGEEDSQALKTFDVEVKVTLKVKARSLNDAKGIVDNIPNDAWHV